MRDTNKRNFELKSRNMSIALKNALIERARGKSLDSPHTYADHASIFVRYIKSEFSVKYLNDITREHVQAYAEHLIERHEAGEIAPSTAKNYLSSVNTSLEQARYDTECRVTARDAGLPDRSNIATQDKSYTAEQHTNAMNKVDERLAAQLELQRVLGLRFKESCLIDSVAAHKEALERGTVTISDGTKGGRSRELPITAVDQIKALIRCAVIQKNDRSMIPIEFSWHQYQLQSYKQISGIIPGFHGERHTYANDRYEALAGVPSPVRANIKHGQSHYTYIAKELGISIQQAKQIDFETRIQISKELGHSRVSITNNYLG